MSFLKNLENKSPAVKAQYAFGFASIITGIITIVWLSTIPSRFSDMAIQSDPDGGEKISDKQNPTELLDSTKSQLGNLIDWNETGTAPLPEEVPTDYAPNMGNLNMQEGTTIYAEDTVEIAPAGEQKEITTQPEPTLEHNPGIVMPTNITPQITPQVTPQKMPEPAPQVPPVEPGGKKVLIEITNVPPKPILIETKSDPQEAPQN